MANHIVTIDGPGGTGKSSVGIELAGRLGSSFLDTGRIYRLFGFMVAEYGFEPDDLLLASSLIGARGLTIIGGKDFNLLTASSWRRIGSGELQREDVEACAAEISTRPEIRDLVNGISRSYVDLHQYCVVVGRDAGTIIAPHASAKFYLDADFETRVGRRSVGDMDAARQSQAIRDRVDESRVAAGAERMASDAIVIETGRLTREDVVGRLEAASRHRGVGRERQYGRSAEIPLGRTLVWLAAELGRDMDLSI